MAVATDELVAPHPLRDDNLEADIEALGMAWSFDPALDLGRIDKERSLHNQARNEALHTPTVEQYAEDMARGDTFPAIVVEVQGGKRERLIVVGGNHRVAAAGIAKVGTLAAYLVTGDAMTLYRLMWADNRRHGLACGDAEKIAAAAYLVNQGDSMATAARTVGITYNKVTEHFASLDADRRAEKLRIKAWKMLPALTRRRLASVTDDDVMRAAVDAVLRHGLNSSDASELVTTLNGAPDSPSAMALLAESDSDLALKGLAASSAERRRGRQSPRATMLSALSTIRHASAARVVADCADDDQRKVLANAIRDSAAVLQQVLRSVDAK